MRNLLPALALALLPAGLAACQTTSRTIVPDTVGRVVTLETNTPVEGARIAPVATEGITISNADGSFSLPAVAVEERRVPLPVSGVYRSSAVLRAEADGLYGFAPVDFVNPDTRATSAVTIALIAPDAPYPEGIIPPECDASEEALYLLRVFAASSHRGLIAAFAADGEYAFAFNQWADRVLVRQLGADCDLPMDQRLQWMEDIDAFTETPAPE
ncbi:hypothetical protein KUV46_05455 [Thalassovita mediterranea]|nr:hypothetical protein KUV46_05455 [Thalassovita mediterranea]